MLFPLCQSTLAVKCPAPFGCHEDHPWLGGTVIFLCYPINIYIYIYLFSTHIHMFIYIYTIPQQNSISKMAHLPYPQQNSILRPLGLAFLMKALKIAYVGTNYHGNAWQVAWISCLRWLMRALVDHSYLRSLGFW